MSAGEKQPKLFAFDLDGTLVHPDEKGARVVPPFLMDTVQEIAQKYHTLIATGRRFRTARPLVEKLPPMEYFVCQNGMVIHGADGRILKTVGINQQDAILASSIMREHRVDPVWVFDSGYEGIEYILFQESLDRNNHMKMLHQRWKDYAQIVAHEDEIEPGLMPHLVEVASVGEYLLLNEFSQRAANLLPPDLRSFVVRNAGYGGLGVLEVFSRHCSKWTGIEEVKSFLNVSEVISFGDDANDLEMLTHADYSVAMDHAQDYIIEAADHSVAGPAGLAKYLRDNWLT